MSITLSSHPSGVQTKRLMWSIGLGLLALILWDDWFKLLGEGMHAILGYLVPSCMKPAVSVMLGTEAVCQVTVWRLLVFMWSCILCHICWYFMQLQMWRTLYAFSHLHEMEGKELCQCWGWLRPDNSWLLLCLHVKADRKHWRLLSWPKQQSISETAVSSLAQWVEAWLRFVLFCVPISLLQIIVCVVWFEFDACSGLLSTPFACFDWTSRMIAVPTAKPSPGLLYGLPHVQVLPMFA